MPMAARAVGPASQKIVWATGMISVRVSASPVALMVRRRRLTELTDGCPDALVQLDVELDRSNSVFVLPHQAVVVFGSPLVITRPRCEEDNDI